MFLPAQISDEKPVKIMKLRVESASCVSSFGGQIPKEFAIGCGIGMRGGHDEETDGRGQGKRMPRTKLEDGRTGAGVEES